MDASDVVRRARKYLGWSQRKMAAFFKVRQATISDWETGKVEPSEAVLKILRMLNED